MNPLIIPCPNKVPCAGQDTPFANLTAEAPDQQLFIGINFGIGNTPNPGDNFNNPGGFGICVVGGSQLLADQCGQRNQIIDQSDSPPGGDGGNWTDPNGDPISIFGNTTQLCTVLCPDGSPFTYQVAAGTYNSTSQAQANSIAQSYACTLANTNKVCVGTLNPNACLNQPYNSTISVQGHGPFTFSVTAGALPPGLTLTSVINTGVVAGTPTTPGNYSFTINAINAGGNFMQKNYSISVLGITTATPLPAYASGGSYTTTLVAVGGTLPYTFSISTGSLPPGFNLDPNSGVISGTSSAQGTTAFTAKVTDATGNACTKNFTVANTFRPGYTLCDFSFLLPLITNAFNSVGGTPTSTAPAWDGVFDHQAVDGSLNPIWYFIGQSIGGFSVSADENPLYPNSPAWENSQCFTFLQYIQIINQWQLIIQDTQCNYTEAFYTGPMGPSAAGTYTFVAGDPTMPQFVSIRDNFAADCCPDAGNTPPVNFNPASPARIRIKNYSAAMFGACPGCDSVAHPEWDGTLPLKCSTGPTNLLYMNGGGNCAENVDIPGLSIGGLQIQNGNPGNQHHEIAVIFHTNNSWSLEIRCEPIVGAPVAFWGGSKAVGDTPLGTYIRGTSGIGAGGAAGPACITIESY
jgi:hypothetical protein